MPITINGKRFDKLTALSNVEGPKQPHTIDPDLCLNCGACLEACKSDAVIRGGSTGSPP